MKAEEYLKETRIKTRIVEGYDLPKLLTDFANKQAKEEAIEFALYQQGILHKVKDGRRLNAWKRRFEKDYNEYQKFKTKNSKKYENNTS